MAEIKLIATDLDGTFLKGGHTPHPENIKAVRACQEAGIRVCACTGRNWAECRKIVEEVGFDDFCAVNNGAAIVEVKTGELRYRNRFDPGGCDAILPGCKVWAYGPGEYWCA